MTNPLVIYIVLAIIFFIGFLIFWPCYERIKHYRLYHRIINFLYLFLAIIILALLVYYLNIKDWIIMISIPSFITFLFYLLGNRVKDLYLIWIGALALTMFNPVKPVLAVIDITDYMQRWILSSIYLALLIIFLFNREK